MGVVEHEFVAQVSLQCGGIGFAMKYTFGRIDQRAVFAYKLGAAVVAGRTAHKIECNHTVGIFCNVAQIEIIDRRIGCNFCCSGIGIAIIAACRFAIGFLNVV